MALVDASELLSDPDFVDDIQVITRIPYVDSLGQNNIQETLVFTVGSVQPADYKEVQKLPESMRVADISSFFFRGQIIAVSPGKYASVLSFRGQRYQVMTVADWSQWGAGYTEGTCVAEVPSP